MKAIEFLKENGKEEYAKQLFGSQYNIIKEEMIHPTRGGDIYARGGDIYGSVVLADGSKVPGVLVTLTGDKIGEFTTFSTEEGNFRFRNLPFGTYELKYELEGFLTGIQKDIKITPW